MKFSIITVAYNSSETLPQTIESLLAQTYSNIEYIIVDGASTDNTVEILKSYNGKISKWISEPDTGIYDAMNKGIRMATGDIIGLLNSDDFYYDKNVLAKIVAEFEKTNAGIIYGNTVIGRFNDKGETQEVTRYVKPGAFQRSRFLYGWMPSHVSVFVKKSVYDKFGLFHQGMKIGADYELCLRFMYKYEVKSHYLDMFCLKFRIGGASTSSLSNKMQALRETQEAWKMNDIKPYFFTVYLKPLRGLWNLITTKLFGT